MTERGFKIAVCEQKETRNQMDERVKETQAKQREEKKACTVK